jgi:plasmid maintenance system antidote protein VapI
MPNTAMPTLDEILAARDLSSDALAVLGQIDPATAYRIRTGQSRPRPTTIVRLARALGIGPRRMQEICDATWDAAHSQDSAAVR